MPLWAQPLAWESLPVRQSNRRVPLTEKLDITSGMRACAGPAGLGLRVRVHKSRHAPCSTIPACLARARANRDSASNLRAGDRTSFFPHGPARDSRGPLRRDGDSVRVRGSDRPASCPPTQPESKRKLATSIATWQSNFNLNCRSHWHWPGQPETRRSQGLSAGRRGCAS